MKHYLVKLLLRLGEYEKHAIHLCRAEDKEAAQLQALQGETHNIENDDDDLHDEHGDWWDDGWIYEVQNIKELTDEQAKTYEALVEFNFLEDLPV